MYKCVACIDMNTFLCACCICIYKLLPIRCVGILTRHFLRSCVVCFCGFSEYDNANAIADWLRSIVCTIFVCVCDRLGVWGYTEPTNTKIEQ